MDKPKVQQRDVDKALLSLLTTTIYTGAEILCYGDSLTAGYCSPEFVPYADELANALGRPVDHAGMCGWTAEQMVRKADAERNKAFGLCYPGLRRLVHSGRYTVVFIMAGTNDLGFTPASTIVENVVQLHRICHDAGVRTVALTVPQSAFASDSTAKGRLSLREKQRDINSLLREFAASCSERCFFVDLEARVPWSAGSTDWMSDGLHMSRKGYQKFGSLLGPLVSDFVAAKKDKTR